MFCEKCGTPMTADEVFCGSCGAAKKAPAAAPQEVMQPPVQNPVPPPPTYTPPPAPQGFAPPPTPQGYQAPPQPVQQGYQTAPVQQGYQTPAQPAPGVYPQPYQQGMPVQPMVRPTYTRGKKLVNVTPIVFLSITAMLLLFAPYLNSYRDNGSALAILGDGIKYLFESDSYFLWSLLILFICVFLGIICSSVKLNVVTRIAATVGTVCMLYPFIDGITNFFQNYEYYSRYTNFGKVLSDISSAMGWGYWIMLHFMIFTIIFSWTRYARAVNNYYPQQPIR